MALKALIFDCDGTLAETEEAHRTAFNLAFAEAGLAWHWDEALYRQLLRVTGGRERIAHFLETCESTLPDRDNAIAAIHVRKNELYATLVATGLVTLRPGVMRLIQEAQAVGIAIAIATTTSQINLNALIAATPLRDTTFAAKVTAEDVTFKKPDPEVYCVALKQLGFDARQCVAFEDSENGLRAAQNAKIATVITPGHYTDDGDFAGAALIVPDLNHKGGENGIVNSAMLNQLLQYI